ncbi:M50 family metallopeptidase [Dethiobacter alkaliphilus]|uniref:Peptidase M50 domain-containing protein n=1 Tax=Dethiobacter alkaliphilus AHT 1 TaxID=555088 RepID=C0GK64_DETAL|nr:M50 family metallopeptidase [Dethiobacter alkaliphilus]EEG76247.1 hypothetical protein DealDRAFT_2873 [Dethiobacter alkaliphilus AHT 1]
MRKKRSKDHILRKLMVSLIFLAIGFLAGFIVAGAGGYFQLPGYAPVLIFILTFFVSLVVHEMGHFISFVTDGVKMRALYLSAFLFITENGRWTLKFRPNSMTLIGGLVVPDVGVIEDEHNFQKMQKAYARAIIAGPVASIFLWLVSVIIIISFFLGSGSLSAAWLVYLGSLTVITLLIIVSSMFQTEAFVGDFPAYKLCKNDRFFAAMQLYQYVLLSSEPEKIRRQNTYLKEVLLNELAEKYGKREVHVFTLNIIDAFLVEYLVGETEELPPVVSDYITYLVDKPQVLSRLKNSEIALLLRAHIIRLLSAQENTKELALDFYQALKRDIEPVNPVKKYIIRQTEHVLGLADHGEYLQNKANIIISPAHDVLKNFPGYYMDELKLNHSTQH